MRLRKNKKLTASIIWSTAASSSSPMPPDELLQAHVCVLNRSPWDASPSPPLSPPRQIYLWPTNFTCISSVFTAYHYLGVFPAFAFVTVIEGDNDSLACDDFLPADYSIDDSMRIIPNSIESGSSGNCHPTSPIVPPKRRPGRPKKAPAAAAAQPPPPPSSGFYYYSGFGPQWGKRRGNGDDDHKPSKPTSDNNNNKKKNGKNVHRPSSGSSSSCSRIIEETDDELDYIDDDDDDEVDGVARKRMRKPVKARSLKSLIM